MRKALFAIVLVSASFAGGAIINGPGLRWAQTILMNRLSVEGEDDADPSASTDPIEEIPSRPIPPLVITPTTPETNNAPSTDPSLAPGDSHRAVARASRPEPAEQTPPKESLSSSSSVSILPGLAPVPEEPSSPGPSSSPPAREPLGSPAVAVTAAPSTGGTDRERDRETARDHDKTSDSTIRKVSLTNPGDAPAPVALSPESSLSTEPTDWAEVREMLRAQGVSRYGTEGEPGGRVRFYCVIPLAGRRAVSQHFEAEGDDDLQAARAALKRVALWKATEAGGSAR